jgi:hypothetical protein
MTGPHAPETWESLEPRLAEGEEVWVELHGRRGEVLVGTDRRLVVLSDGHLAADWPWEEVDDVAAAGGRGVIRVRRLDRSTALAIEPVGDTADVMQAVTVLALLAVDAARYGARLEALRDPDRAARPRSRGSALGAVPKEQMVARPPDGHELEPRRRPGPQGRAFDERQPL